MGGTGWAVREFSWDNKYAGVQILLSKVMLEGKAGPYTSTLKQYQAKANYFTCSCLQKNDGYNVQFTPGGLMYVRQWNNMQYASSAAFLLAVYSQYLSEAKAVISCPEATMKPQDLLIFAKSQVDYMLGKNPKSMSYLVGYGANYPKQVHHRGASIASIFDHNSVVGCVEGFDAWYNRPGPDPNVIYGALVGGPDNYDNFDDVRTDYDQTEPTLSGTASLVGLFSKLRSTSTYSAGPYVDNAPKTPYASPTDSYHQHIPTKPYPQPIPSSPMSGKTEVVVKFMHSITATWTHKGDTFYRHRVLIKNMSDKPIRDLKLKIENLEGTLYGLMPTNEKYIYQVPPHLRVLQAGADLSFVYIQGGPQAKVSILSYN